MSIGSGIAIAGIWLGAAAMAWVAPATVVVIAGVACFATLTACLPAIADAVEKPQ